MLEGWTEEMNHVPRPGPLVPAHYVARVLDPRYAKADTGAKMLVVKLKIWTRPDKEAATIERTFRLTYLTREGKMNPAGARIASEMADACVQHGEPARTNGVPDPKKMKDRVVVVKLGIEKGTGEDEDGIPYGDKNSLQGVFRFVSLTAIPKPVGGA